MANYKLTMAGWKGRLFEVAMGDRSKLSDEEILENHWSPFCEVWKEFEQFYSKHIDLTANDPSFDVRRSASKETR